MICRNCGLGFPDEQTGTPLEHKPERCKELNDAAMAEMLPRLQASLVDALVRDGLPREYAEEAVGLRLHSAAADSASSSSSGSSSP